MLCNPSLWLILYDAASWWFVQKWFHLPVVCLFLIPYRWRVDKHTTQSHSRMSASLRARDYFQLKFQAKQYKNYDKFHCLRLLSSYFNHDRVKSNGILKAFAVNITRKFLQLLLLFSLVYRLNESRILHHPMIKFSCYYRIIGCGLYL